MTDHGFGVGTNFFGQLTGFFGGQVSLNDYVNERHSNCYRNRYSIDDNPGVIPFLAGHNDMLNSAR